MNFIIVEAPYTLIIPRKKLAGFFPGTNHRIFTDLLDVKFYPFLKICYNLIPESFNLN